MNWLCAQIGAREHYAIPRALSRNDPLTALYTDFWATPAVRKFLLSAFQVSAFPLLGSLAARFHPGLAKTTVHSWNLRSLAWELSLRRRSVVRTRESAVNGQSSVVGGQFDGFMEVGRKFACAVRDSLRQRRDLPQDAILFAYDTGALEAFEWAREHGIRCVLNQMDPNRVEVDLVREEARRWPGWELRQLEVPEEYFRRREREWALADRVVVNSQFCKDALVKQGVAPEKLFILPLCYEVEPTRREPALNNLTSDLRPPTTGPLRVLFLGQVILRKGIQYLMEAARRLENENIRFDIVGAVGISEDAVASAPRNIKFHGRANRVTAAGCYQQADVFVLPTLSDGFALTQLEAMAHGLPVITTPCCGEVVSDGVDGFVVPPRDAQALAKALQNYLNEPELLKSHQAAAREKSRQFSLDRLAKNLLTLEADLEERGGERKAWSVDQLKAMSQP